MAKTILIEEFHITVLAPVSLSKSAQTAMRRTLNEEHFQARLCKAIRDAFRRRPSLKHAKINLNR